MRRIPKIQNPGNRVERRINVDGKVVTMQLGADHDATEQQRLDYERNMLYIRSGRRLSDALKQAEAADQKPDTSTPVTT